MAKTSAVDKNRKREALAKRLAAKRRRLKAIASDKTLAGEERFRVNRPGTETIMHAEVKIGDSMVEMGEAHGTYQPMASMFYLYVKDCDAMYARALRAGATSISEPQDHPYGDRSGGVRDPFGNLWFVATRIKDVTA